jgi:hypothetical protein
MHVETLLTCVPGWAQRHDFGAQGVYLGLAKISLDRGRQLVQEAQEAFRRTGALGPATSSPTKDASAQPSSVAVPAAAERSAGEESVTVASAPPTEASESETGPDGSAGTKQLR